MQPTKILQNTSLRIFERNDALTSSGLIDAFPLPFQEVIGTQYGTQTQCHSNIVTQDSWQSGQRCNHAYSSAQPLGLGCSLLNNHHGTPTKKDTKQAQPLQISLPLPLLKGTSSSFKCHEDDSDSQKKRQPTSMSLSHRRGTDSTTSSSGGDVLLPEDFTPRKWSVLVGRDKKCIAAHGNKRLHVIIRWYLQQYAKSHKNKEAKSRIISEIEATVRSACQDEGGAFIKYSNGRWWEVDPSQVREKISRMIREALHANYSSSSRQKRARRRLLQESVSSTMNEVKVTPVSSS